MKRSLVIAAAFATAACGRMAPLEPAPGQPLPVKPLLARTTPSPEQLLDTPTFANPGRVDELMKRSEPRQADRFDLPPPAGGAAPELPGTEEDRSSEAAGPATPDEPR